MTRQKWTSLTWKTCLYSYILICVGFIMLFRLFKNLLFHILIYWLVLFLIHQYTPGRFWVEASNYDVFLTFALLALCLRIVTTIVKVVLNFLTLPLRYMTFWAFSLVLNMLLLYIFEYVVNDLWLWITVHLWNIVQVFVLSLLFSTLAFVIKKFLLKK